MDRKEIHRCWSSSTSPAGVAQQNGILRRHCSPLAIRAKRSAAAGGRASLVTRAAPLVTARRPRHAPAALLAARRSRLGPRRPLHRAASHGPRRSPPMLVAARALPALPAAAALGPRQPP